MGWLIVLLTLYLAPNHWLLTPLLNWSSGLLEGRALPWLGVILLAWLMAGRTAGDT